LGTAYYNLNNNAEALKQFRTLIDQYPNSPDAEDALDNVKTIYIETGKPDEYASFMRQVGRPLSIDTEDSLTYAAAETQYDNGKATEALNAFNNYLQRFPSGAYTLDAQFNGRRSITAAKTGTTHCLPMNRWRQKRLINMLKEQY
jgi:TolA-binding protein